MPRCASFAEFERKLAKDTTALAARLTAAKEETIRESQGIVWERVPFGFGELHNSIHPEPEAHPVRLVADAPHAAPVEVGSVPHMPPVEPLQVWAAMKGMDDPERAGWAIAIKISQEGTRPTWYMRSSLPEIREELGRQIGKAFAEHTSRTR